MLTLGRRMPAVELDARISVSTTTPLLLLLGAHSLVCRLLMPLLSVTSWLAMSTIAALPWLPWVLSNSSQTTTACAAPWSGSELRARLLVCPSGVPCFKPCQIYPTLLFLLFHTGRMRMADWKSFQYQC